jgi:hypothetical protein
VNGGHLHAVGAADAVNTVPWKWCWMDNPPQSTVSARQNGFAAAVLCAGFAVAILCPVLVVVIASVARTEWHQLPCLLFHSGAALTDALPWLNLATWILLPFILLQTYRLSPRPLCVFFFLGLIASVFVIGCLPHGPPPAPSDLLARAGVVLLILWAFSIASFIEIALRNLSRQYYLVAASEVLVTLAFWFDVGYFALFGIT